METLKISKDVWHRRFIEMMLGEDHFWWVERRGALDTCKYRTSFLISAFMFAVLMTATFMFSFFTVFGAINHVMTMLYLDYGWFVAVDETIRYAQAAYHRFFAAGVALGVAVWAVIFPLSVITVFLCWARFKYKDSRPQVKESKPSSTKVLYQSFREKFCQKIELE